MAAGEKRKTSDDGNIISQVSWTDGTTQDVYYGMDHSFQYSSNINCDDELHGIKLSTKAHYIRNSYAKCHLLSLGRNGVMALPVDTRKEGDEILLKRFQYNSATEADPGWVEMDSEAGLSYSYNYDAVEGVVFQDRYWFGSNRTAERDGELYGYLTSVPLDGNSTAHGRTQQKIYLPWDHPESTDESIEDATNIVHPMMGNISAILNYNNTRLVVASGQEIWVYYPELDHGLISDEDGNPNPQGGYLGTQGRKKVLTYEPGVVVVGLTCTFEYLKTWCVDEGWNTKVYYYQGNNNLRNTFVYNLVDLTGVRVVKVYNINGIDYFVSSIDGSDGYVNLYKLVGTTPVALFKQRAGLDPLDVNFKAPYFVGPVGMSAAYSMGKFYIADAYGLFQFTYSPDSFDKGYMKRGLYDNHQVYGVCENQGWLYVSTEDGCYAMRVWDTGVDEYQEKGVLISREYEGKEGGTITKMLDEIRLNYELNPWTQHNGRIDVYVSPNNLWKNTNPQGTGLPVNLNQYSSNNYDGWYHVMTIKQENGNTRTEKSYLLNNLGPNETSAFKFDWQTITYAIVITRNNTETKATPIVRQIDLRYHCKEKINNVYNLKNN